MLCSDLKKFPLGASEGVVPASVNLTPSHIPELSEKFTYT